MMIIRKILILILCIISLYSKGQTYHPMLGDSCVWYITRCFEGCYTDKYYTDGDTVINGMNYQKYFRRMPPEDILYAFLREDTANKKVFFKGNDTYFINNSAEFVLYDFSLKSGDSFLWIYPKLWATTSTSDDTGWHTHYEFRLDTLGWAKVHEVSTFQSMTGDRLQLSLSLYPLTGDIVYQMRWIESFGLYAGSYEDRMDLNCFFRKGVKELEGFYYPQYQVCDYNLTGINSLEGDHWKITNDNVQLRILMNDIIAGETDLRIIDINGRVVHHCKITSAETMVDIAKLTKGIYIVSVKDKVNQLTGKIIKY